jgi:hypothetical protein
LEGIQMPLSYILLLHSRNTRLHPLPLLVPHMEWAITHIMHLVLVLVLILHWNIAESVHVHVLLLLLLLKRRYICK